MLSDQPTLGHQLSVCASEFRVALAGGSLVHSIDWGVEPSSNSGGAMNGIMALKKN